jgi:hypothetical protein
VEWSLDGPLPKLCPVIPTSNQDGHQAKNRKRGDEIIPLEMHFFVDSIYVNYSQNLAFPTSHFVIELLPFDYLSNQKQ